MKPSDIGVGFTLLGDFTAVDWTKDSNDTWCLLTIGDTYTSGVSVQMKDNTDTGEPEKTTGIKASNTPVVPIVKSS